MNEHVSTSALISLGDPRISQLCRKEFTVVFLRATLSLTEQLVLWRFKRYFMSKRMYSFKLCFRLLQCEEPIGTSGLLWYMNLKPVLVKSIIFRSKTHISRTYDHWTQRLAKAEKGATVFWVRFSGFIFGQVYSKRSNESSGQKARSIRLDLILSFSAPREFSVSLPVAL